MKILIVEDHELPRLGLVNALLREGFDVYQAENGLEGLELVMEEDFDLVVTDLMMPRMTGFEMLRKFKKCNLCQEIPIIILSNVTNLSAGLDLFDLDVYDYSLEEEYSLRVQLNLDTFRQYVEARLNRGILQFFFKRDINFRHFIHVVKKAMKENASRQERVSGVVDNQRYRSVAR